MLSRTRYGRYDIVCNVVFVRNGGRKHTRAKMVGQMVYVMKGGLWDAPKTQLSTKKDILKTVTRVIGPIAKPDKFSLILDYQKREGEKSCVGFYEKLPKEIRQIWGIQAPYLILRWWMK